MTKKTIYIVEDSEFFSLLLDQQLQETITHNIMDFKSAEECIAHIREAKAEPALIILDYQLPGMNGLEALEEIKKLSPKTRVVILSSRMDGELAVELMKKGADDVISKKQGYAEKLIEDIDELVK
ncbi:MAG: response regulator [Bacteroidia bacterium]